MTEPTEHRSAWRHLRHLRWPFVLIVCGVAVVILILGVALFLAIVFGGLVN